MLTYEDLVELAKLCARNSRISTSSDVAKELWQMAKEYQAEAGKLGDVPEVDEAPPFPSEDRYRGRGVYSGVVPSPALFGSVAEFTYSSARHDRFGLGVRHRVSERRI